MDSIANLVIHERCDHVMKYILEKLNLNDTSKYSHVKKVILLSGKYKSGKDYIGRRLTENLSALYLNINELIKLQYDKIHTKDSSDSEDIYQTNIIKWREENSREDPTIFCRMIIEEKDQLCSSYPIWIINDIKYDKEIEYLKTIFDNRLLFVRIDALNEIRQKRGWNSQNDTDNSELDSQLCMDNLPDTQSELNVESSSTSEDDLDPRIQIEFDRLNYANEAINSLELQLDDARKTLKELWNISQEELSLLEKSIGTSVAKAKSYYEARIKLREAKEILTKAKHRFERAQALHVAAKELAIASADYIDEAEQSSEHATEWSETYHQAVEKAANAEREKYLADFDQQRAEVTYSEIEALVQKLEKDSRRSINKSKPYYEKKVEFHKELEFHKRKVSGLENCVNEAKCQYQQSLKNLEIISNEIHARRERGKLPNELGEETSNLVEKSFTHTEETTTIISQQLTMNSPTKSPQKDSSNTVLRSCLLRTETLPTGIFTNSNNRHIPEENEVIKPNNSFNDQFILCSKQAPQPILINSSIGETMTLDDDLRDRVESISSQLTDENDDKAQSLHILSDEQLDHLASVYHPYSTELSSETGMHNQSFAQSKSILSDSMLY
ncbi:unnamed protein product [Adineta steineri]|nr:unnamed protein product [Adineta steineri]